MPNTVSSCILWIAGAVAQCLAQTANSDLATMQLTLTGTVVEFGTNSGIEDVEVTIVEIPTAQTDSLGPTTGIGKTKTTSVGKFVFILGKPATYRISVHKEGFVVPGGFTQGFSSSSTLVVDGVVSPRSIRFALGRPAAVAGTVLDADTRKPVAGLPVSLRQYGFARGRPTAFPGGGGNTDADGHFAVQGLAPGEYVAVTGSLMRTAAAIKALPDSVKYRDDRLLTSSSKEEVDSTDLDYDWTYWPSGTSDLSTAFPIMLYSGGSTDLGILLVRRVTMFRVRVSVSKDTCVSDEVVVLDVRRNLDVWRPTRVGTLPCGVEGVMRGFSSGSYRLETAVAGTGGSTPGGTLAFEIVDKNLSLTVPLRQGVDIEGSVVPSRDGAKIDVSGIRLALRPTDWAAQEGWVAASHDGTVRFLKYVVRDYQLLVSGLPKTCSIKEVTYNGSPIEGDLLRLNSAAPRHSFTVILDDKVSSVLGSVQDSDRFEGGVQIFLAKWPPSPIDVFDSVLSYTSEDGRHFEFDGLGPGEYRIVAIPAAARPKLEKPGVLEYMLAKAEKVLVTEGQSRSVTIKVTEP